MLASWKKSYDKPRQPIKNQRHYFANIEAMVFLVIMYRCEIWTKRRLSAKELMLLNCAVGEDS